MSPILRRCIADRRTGSDCRRRMSYQELTGAPACAHYTNVRHAAATPQHSSPMGALATPLARGLTACGMHSELPKHDGVMYTLEGIYIPRLVYSPHRGGAKSRANAPSVVFAHTPTKTKLQTLPKE